MPLKIKIMEVGEEAQENAAENEEIWNGVWEDEEAEEEDSVLTDFTVEDCFKAVEDIEGKNEYLSRNIYGIEVKGKLGISDPSKECRNVNILFDWFKEVAHQEETYKKIVVEFTDNMNELYDTIIFEKAFLVEYREECTHEMGFLEFYAFIRKFDDTEEAIMV